MENVIKFEWIINGQKFIERFQPFSETVLAKQLKYYETEFIFGNDDTEKNFEADNSYEDPSAYLISDYLIEAHSTIMMMRYHNNQNENSILNKEINKILIYDTMVLCAVNLAKWDISVLSKIEFNTKHFKLEKVVLDFVRLLRSTITSEGIHHNEEFSLAFSELIKEARNNNKLIDLCSEIVSWVNHLSSEDIKEYEVVEYNRILDRKIKEIPAAMGPGYHRRHKEVKRILNHYRNTRVKTDFEYEYTISISTQDYNHEKTELVELIQKEIEHVESNLINSEDSKEVLQDKIRVLQDFFGSTKSELCGKYSTRREKRQLQKYCNGGCFAIVHTKDANYFSLSGIGDYCGKQKCSMINNNNAMVRIAKDINKELFNDAYVYAPLSDSTLRYTKIYKKREDKVIYINPPVSLGQDNEISKEDVGLYACCERKIQALHNDNTDLKILFSRWTPCCNCVPALLREEEIEVYALYQNSKEFFELRDANNNEDFANRLARPCLPGYTFIDNNLNI